MRGVETKSENYPCLWISDPSAGSWLKGVATKSTQLPYEANLGLKAIGAKKDFKEY